MSTAVDIAVDAIRTLNTRMREARTRGDVIGYEIARDERDACQSRLMASLGHRRNPPLKAGNADCHIYESF